MFIIAYPTTHFIQMFSSIKKSIKQGLDVYKKIFSFSFVIQFTIGKNLGKSIQCGTWPLSFCTQSTLNFLCWGGKKSTETYSKERLGVFVVFEGGTIKNLRKETSLCLSVCLPVWCIKKCKWGQIKCLHRWRFSSSRHLFPLLSSLEHSVLKNKYF